MTAKLIQMQAPNGILAWQKFISGIRDGKQRQIVRLMMLGYLLGHTDDETIIGGIELMKQIEDKYLGGRTRGRKDAT
jgi:hypothetical protein